MAQKRLYRNNAARQAAYRARKEEPQATKPPTMRTHQSELGALVLVLHGVMLRAARNGDTLAIMNYENQPERMLQNLIRHCEANAPQALPQAEHCG